MCKGEGYNSEKERKAAIDKAQSELDFWKGVADELAKRNGTADTVAPQADTAEGAATDVAPTDEGTGVTTTTTTTTTAEEQPTDNKGKARRKPKGFNKPEKKTVEQLFEEEKAKFAPKAEEGNEYGRILGESATWQDAVRSMLALKAKYLAEAEDWRNRKYKDNKTKVSGEVRDDAGREFTTTIEDANERRRLQTIKNLEKQAAEIDEWINTFAERLGIDTAALQEVVDSYQATANEGEAAAPVADTVDTTTTTPAADAVTATDTATDEATTASDEADKATTDSQGNPINADGTLKLEKIESIDDLTDDDFSKPSRNVELPKLPKKVDDAIGANGKPVIIKKNIFTRNAQRHNELSADDSRKILESALYNPDLYGQNQKAKRPYNWVVINTKDKDGNNRLVLIELSPEKGNAEIVHWHYIDNRGLEKIKRQAEREGGQLLILPSKSEEAGALSSRTVDLSSESKDTTPEGEKQVADDKTVDSDKGYKRMKWDQNSDYGEVRSRLAELESITEVERYARVFPESASLEEELRRLSNEYGGRNNIPGAEIDALAEKYKEYIAIKNEFFEEIRELRELLPLLEIEQSKRMEEEAEKAKMEHLRTAYNGFLVGKSAMTSARIEKVLEKRVNFANHGVMTIAQFIETMYESGKLQPNKSEEKPTISRTRWNRMNDSEQKDWERTHNGARTKYYVNDYDLGKTAYDYAIFLQGDSSVDSTKVQTKEGQTEAKPFHDANRSEEFNELVNLIIETDKLADAPEQTDAIDAQIERNSEKVERIMRGLNDEEFGALDELFYGENPLFGKDSIYDMTYDRIDEERKLAKAKAEKQAKERAIYDSEQSRLKHTYDQKEIDALSKAYVDAKKESRKAWRVLTDSKDEERKDELNNAYDRASSKETAAKKALESKLAEYDDKTLVEIGKRDGDISQITHDIIRGRGANRALVHEYVNMLDNQGEISGKGKPKYRLIDFVDKKSERIPVRGIYHDNGYAIATNLATLVADKRAYSEADNGKIIDSKGEEIAMKFPAWRKIMPKAIRANGIDAKELLDFLAGVKEKAKAAKEKYDNCEVIMNIGGTIWSAKAEQLEKFAQAALSLGGKIYLQDRAELASSPMHTESANGFAMVMPVDMSANYLSGGPKNVFAYKPTTLGASEQSKVYKETHPNEAVNDTAAEAPNNDGNKAADTQSAKTEAKKEVAKVEAQPKQKGNAVEKIEDVGEKIGGAKKDLAAEAKQRMADDLEKSDSQLASEIAEKPLSKIFNFDLPKLRTSGMSNEVISFIKICKQMIPTKPRVGYKVRRWVSETMEIYKLCLIAGAKWEQLSEMLQGKYADSKLAKMYNSYMAVGGFDSGLELNGAYIRQLGADAKMYDGGKEVSLAGKWYVSGAAKHSGTYDTKEEAIEALKAYAGDNAVPKSSGKKQIEFVVYRNNTTGKFFITPKGKGDIILQDGFETSKEAFAYIKEHNAEMAERYQTLLSETKVDFNENRERKGRDYRGDKDISAQEFMDTFGFRGVEFGNWTNQKDRAKSINECYDALMDLADVLGVDPKALSLNGTLGMAFGARGGGKFSAHYEPDKVVINLTKTKGAGSLAHEWFHAVDNYFAKMGGAKFGFATSKEGLFPEGITMIPRSKGNYLYYDSKTRGSITEEEYKQRLANHGVRKEMVDAWVALMNAINASGYKKRSGEYAYLHSSNYWTEPTELGARAFSKWVENELSKRNATNDYLANNPAIFAEGANEYTRRYSPYPFDTDAQWMEEAFGNLFSTMEQKTDAESGKVMLYHKADGTVTELTSKEAALRNSILDLLHNAGIEVITDNKEAQRVLDNENRNGLTRGLRLAIEDKEKGTGENPTAISDVTDPSIWDSSSSDAKVDNRIEVIDGSNVKLDELSSKIESNGELLPEDFLLSIENALGSDNGNVDKSQYFKTDGDVTLRVANHRMNSRMFLIHDNTTGNTSIVVKMSERRFRSNKNVEAEEYVYFPDKLTKDVQLDIIDGLKEWIATGKYNRACDQKNVSEISRDGVRMQKVYHGSGADFDAFDFSHMGEGEGAQAYGWGGYVTEVEGIGRAYARSSSSTKTLNRSRLRHEISFLEESLPFWSGEAKLEGEERLKQLEEELYRLESEPEPVLYTVEIPDDNGENYITWSKGLPKSQRKKIADHLRTLPDFLLDTQRQVHGSNWLPNGWNTLANVIENNPTWGKDIVERLKDAFGSSKEASMTLSDIGFVGISYPAQYRSGGRNDGTKNYVIFNESDMKITDKARFFRTKDGVAYGFTIGGKIYIDTSIAKADTPIHEYTHLWASALRESNPKEWANVVSLMKGTPVWDEVLQNYPELTTDDEIADEVLAHYSGQRGAERLREAQRKAAEESVSVMASANAVSAIERVRKALSKFWKGVADLLNIHFTTAEEVADRVLYDLLRGYKPQSKADSNVRLQKTESEEGDLLFRQRERSRYQRKPSRCTS